MDPVTLVNTVPASTPATVLPPTGAHSLVDERSHHQARRESPSHHASTETGSELAGNRRVPQHTYMPPSESLDEPRHAVDTVPQQGSTQPGDGSEVHTDRSQKRHEVPFKERVVGVAQVTRGTLLGKPDLKAHGEAILDGRTTHEQDRNL